jgi:hypothetical protein
MSIFHLSKIEPEKTLPKKALVTGMLSFWKKGEKCCEHNFFQHFPTFSKKKHLGDFLFILRCF